VHGRQRGALSGLVCEKDGEGDTHRQPWRKAVGLTKSEQLLAFVVFSYTAGIVRSSCENRSPRKQFTEGGMEVGAECAAAGTSSTWVQFCVPRIIRKSACEPQIKKLRIILSRLIFFQRKRVRRAARLVSDAWHARVRAISPGLDSHGAMYQ
jgi:hypothetical protein